jgi:hypothetical protein
MKYKLSLVAAALLGGVLFGNSPARAGGFAEFDANPITGAGKFHVLVQQEGNSLTYDVFVQANTASPPNSAGASVTVFFLDKFNNEVGISSMQVGNVLDAAAGTPLPYFTGNVLRDQWGFKPNFGTTNLGKWDDSIAPSTGSVLDKNGDDYLFGKLTLTSDPNFVDVTVQDGHVWESTATLTPEMSSLALLLPGLLPVGFAIRRRRAAKA